MSKEKTPNVTEDSWEIYKTARDKIAGIIRYGVIPNILALQEAQNELNELLTTDSRQLLDAGDRVLLETFNPKSYPVGVRQAINQMDNKFNDIITKATEVDLALKTAGKNQYFNIPLPPE